MNYDDCCHSPGWGLEGCHDDCDEMIAFRQWEKYWAALTPEEKEQEYEAMALYAEECARER